MHIPALILTSSRSSALLRRFFVYPDPMGSEEPSQTLIFSGSSITPAPGGAKNRV
jgi:hypothetical protein